MERVKELTRSTPGPAKQPKRLKPFVQVPFENNPWSLCRPEHKDVILVTYGHAWKYAQMLTANLTEGERYWAIDKRHIHRLRDRRAFQIRLKTMRGTSVVGGKIWLRNAKGHSITIHDVKGMFQLNFHKIAKRYGTDDLAEIMERTRESLGRVGITAHMQNWYKCASLTEHLWNKLDINLSNVPAISAPKGPGNLQGYNVFGHTDHPVYAYDIHSAYLSVMAEFPALQPFTDHVWSARKELEQANDPAAFLLKVAATVMPGKFTSDLPDNKYYRPVLGNYIRQQVNSRLTRAMNIANSREAPTRANVYRWCVDGFLAYSDISKYLDIGDALGQWKPTKRHNRLTIWKTNVWWSDREFKDAGYDITEQQALDALAVGDPFTICTSRTVFDWDRLEERVEPIALRQPHGLIIGACNKCWEDIGDLHDAV